MAVDTKKVAFGIVVGATILTIMYYLEVVPSSYSWLRPPLPFPVPSSPSPATMLVEQPITGTLDNNMINKSLSEISEAIFFAMRKQRRHFLLDARERNINLLGGGQFFRLCPPVFTCPYKVERIGGNHYGKFACGIRELYGINQKTPNRSCVMYSFGVGPEVAFDEGVLGITNCKVFAYDHTVKNGIPSRTKESRDPRRMAYQKIGVEEYHKFNSTYLKSIKQLMKINGHDWIDMLKVDVEVAEYGSLSMLMDDFEDEGILPFDQLLVEVHVITVDHMWSGAIPWLNPLEAMGLRVVHAEKNPACYCYEYNYVNVRGKTFRNSTFSFFQNGWADMRQFQGKPNLLSPFQVI